MPDAQGPVAIPGYELLEPIGRGGNGLVFKARQLSLNRLVAIKILRPERCGEEVPRQRFLQEARSIARLSHEGIVHAHDFGEAGGSFFFVMELVDGEPLSKGLAREGPMPERRVLELALQVAEALAYIHAHGLVHRDIKPENLVLTASGRVKLLDLGLVRLSEGSAALTAAGTAVGTPAYMSPEQIRNSSEVDIRSDLYSLGSTLYHLLSGAEPFPAGSIGEVLEKVLYETPAPLRAMRADLGASTIGLVERLMAKEPAARFQSPAELVVACRACLEGPAAAVRASSDGLPAPGPAVLRPARTPRPAATPSQPSAPPPEQPPAPPLASGEPGRASPSLVATSTLARPAPASREAGRPLRLPTPGISGARPAPASSSSRAPASSPLALSRPMPAAAATPASSRTVPSTALRVASRASGSSPATAPSAVPPASAPSPGSGPGRGSLLALAVAAAVLAGVLLRVFLPPDRGAEGDAPVAPAGAPSSTASLTPAPVPALTVAPNAPDAPHSDPASGALAAATPVEGTVETPANAPVESPAEAPAREPVVAPAHVRAAPPDAQGANVDPGRGPAPAAEPTGRRPGPDPAQLPLDRLAKTLHAKLQPFPDGRVELIYDFSSAPQYEDWLSRARVSPFAELMRQEQALFVSPNAEAGLRIVLGAMDTLEFDVRLVAFRQARKGGGVKPRAPSLAGLDFTVALLSRSAGGASPDATVRLGATNAEVTAEVIVGARTGSFRAPLRGERPTLHVALQAQQGVVGVELNGVRLGEVPTTIGAGPLRVAFRSASVAVIDSVRVLGQVDPGWLSRQAPGAAAEGK
ncbi:MAG: protein kinase [Planctomycetes bacterium]|nr:protein kinase [Planctomycetota bacterium]